MPNRVVDQAGSDLSDCNSDNDERVYSEEHASVVFAATDRLASVQKGPVPMKPPQHYSAA